MLYVLIGREVRENACCWSSEALLLPAALTNFVVYLFASVNSTIHYAYPSITEGIYLLLSLPILLAKEDFWYKLMRYGSFHVTQVK